MKQSTFDLPNKTTGPVECLGETFPSEDARREHYLKLLAQKLKDPEFRKIEGFPIGKDEDILALSDPPYYTACPNPWLGEFIAHYGTPFDPKLPYHREPFAADVSVGKTHPLYKAHTYYTKVPHQAIVPALLHYTVPGDVVLDAFCGTGMTGVAAKHCSHLSAARITEIRNRFPELSISATPGPRFAVLNDLSPYATFISSNYNQPRDWQVVGRRLTELLEELRQELGWMYKTTCPSTHKDAEIEYTVWSEVFSCPECAGEITFLEQALDKETQRVSEVISCPSCTASNLKKANLELVFESKLDPLLERQIRQPKRRPVIISYKLNGQRVEKSPDSADSALLERIEKTEFPEDIPIREFPFDDMWETPRLKQRGISHVHHLFLKRALISFSFLWQRACRVEHLDVRSGCLFVLEQMLRNLSILNSYEPLAYSQNSRGQKSAYYVPSQHSEIAPWYFLKGKIKAVVNALSGDWTSAGGVMITSGSATALTLPSGSIDYIFTDPPFGDNFPYSELNFFAEQWHRVATNSQTEAVVDRTKKNRSKQKSVFDYQGLMRAAFAEYFRVLKPGRWLTVVFSNTKASIWNAIQTALQEVGFVVANVAALDKQQGSFRAVTTTTAVKQDLVISAYKPNGGLEERFARRGETEEGVWDFIRTHLKNLPVVKPKGGQLEPIAERDPRILYDRMVAFYVGHSTLVPLSSAEFQAGLAEKFPERDGMYFLPEQVNEYDKKRAQMVNIGQLAIFVEDERSAINWLRSFLKDRPSTYQDIQPEFMQQLSASWKKWETRPELSALLDQSFLCYDGTGEVPSQIHSYLSTQFKDLRNLPKDHVQLKAKAKNRWFVPDPKNLIQVEQQRNKKLLEEFWTYLPDGYTPPALTANAGQMLPGLAAPRPKIPKGKKLKELRSEAVRVGFKHCYQQKDYQTILVVAEMLPESVLNEDEQLQMLYDTAVTRSGAGE